MDATERSTWPSWPAGSIPAGGMDFGSVSRASTNFRTAGLLPRYPKPCNRPLYTNPGQRRLIRSKMESETPRMKKASFILISALMLTGCGTVRISRILADPARYHNRSVTVQGRVTSVAGALNMGVYQVDDGSGKIYVISNRGVPSRDARVKVEGMVTPGVNVMGMTMGTAITERGHRVRF